MLVEITERAMAHAGADTVLIGEACMEIPLHAIITKSLLLSWRSWMQSAVARNDGANGQGSGCALVCNGQ
jgi:hypothetical protein